MAALGADLTAAGPPPPIDFEVWPENWNAVMFYLGLSTQWRLAPMGGVVGLDYTGVEAAMRMQRIPAAERPALFDQLRIMELAALPILNARKPDAPAN